MQNFLTTTAIRKVRRCHHSKYYTGASAEPHCFGMKLEKIKSWEQKYFEKQKRQVQVVRENLQLAQSRQKSYADHRRQKLSFQVSDFVHLKVSPMRGLHRFKIRGPCKIP
jgi:hypothetical protein